jgi:hypothetical protein
MKIKKQRDFEDGFWKRWKLFDDEMNKCNLVGIKALWAIKLYGYGGYVDK